MTPLIFGEVLYDCFPDGNDVLGGAPFNVAWHLQGFGLDPLMLSRIGNDALGSSVRQRMNDWHMRTDLLQTDAEHPSGRVLVSLDEKGSAQYEIAAEQAYDYIDAQPALAMFANEAPALLYHGSLALRQAVSRQALTDLKNRLNSPIFLDINLRAPWWTPDAIKPLLQQATWAKLNDDELRILDPDFADSAKWNTCLNRFCQTYNLHTLIVTLGGDGALLKQAEQDSFLVMSPPPVNIVDTVGAGDSFSAVCILGILQNWAPELILERAVGFAAEICQIRGATSNNHALYEQYQQHWRA
jgi:fructokinase